MKARFDEDVPPDAQVTYLKIENRALGEIMPRGFVWVPIGYRNPADAKK